MSFSKINFPPPNIISFPVATFIALVSPFNHKNDDTFVAFMVSVLGGGIFGYVTDDSKMSQNSKNMISGTALSLGAFVCVMNLYKEYHYLLPNFGFSINLRFLQTKLSICFGNVDDAKK